MIRAKYRNAFSIVELVVSLTILTTLISSLLPAVHWYRQELRRIANEHLAASELENLMDLAVQPAWEDITTEKTGQLKISSEILQQLPNLLLIADVQPEAGAKRIQLTLQMQHVPSGSVRPLRLTAWKYRTTTGPDKEPFQ